jgi:hypothetical protein
MRLIFLELDKDNSKGGVQNPLTGEIMAYLWNLLDRINSLLWKNIL